MSELEVLLCKIYEDNILGKSVGNFNKQVKHAKTEADWICSDEQVVQAYLKDPYCGHGFSVSLFTIWADWEF